jgi:hypothetical protein
LAELVLAGCRVTILADRGFGDQKLFAFLVQLGFGQVIRFRRNIHVTARMARPSGQPNGSARAARARKLRHARVTAKAGSSVPWCASMPKT